MSRRNPYGVINTIFVRCIHHVASTSTCSKQIVNHWGAHAGFPEQRHRCRRHSARDRGAGAPPHLSLRVPPRFVSGTASPSRGRRRGRGWQSRRAVRLFSAAARTSRDLRALRRRRRRRRWQWRWLKRRSRRWPIIVASFFGDEFLVWGSWRW